jgi:hypothetical protein
VLYDDRGNKLALLLLASGNSLSRPSNLCTPIFMSLGSMERSLSLTLKQ